MPYAQKIQDFVDQYPVLKAIGNTPLVELNLPWDIGDSSIHAKLRMLSEAVISGKLKKGKTILDATSGNAGIAYAMVGAILGFPVELVMPENASEERKKRLKYMQKRVLIIWHLLPNLFLMEIPCISAAPPSEMMRTARNSGRGYSILLLGLLYRITRHVPPD